MDKSDTTPKRFYPTHRAAPLLLGLLAMTAIALVLYGTGTYGVGISPDSVSYLSTAKNLLQGKGFVNYSEGYYLRWPPLFPLVLALAGLSGSDSTQGARLVNAASLGLIVFLSGQLLLKHIRSKLIAFLVTLSVLFSLPLLNASVMAWAEPLYILCSIISLRALSGCLKQDSLIPLLLCSAFASLACLQRYMGITLVITGIVSLSFFSRHPSRHTRITAIALFCLLSITPSLPWLVRNYLISGTFTGHMYPAYYGLLKNISLTGEVLGSWFLPALVPAPLRSLMTIIAITSLVIASRVLRSRHKPHDHTKRYQALKPMLLYCGIYTAFLIMSCSLKAYGPIDDSRFLAPLYPFVMLLLFSMLDDVYHWIQAIFDRKRWVTIVMVGVLCAWLCYPIINSLSAIASWRVDGAGEEFYGKSYYGKRAWQESPLAAWVRTHPPGDAVYSNEPLALYALTGIAAQMSPLRNTSLAQLNNTWPVAQTSWLVWFNDRFEGKSRFFWKGNQAYPVSELRGFFDFEEVRSFPDGSIYGFKPSDTQGSELTNDSR